MALTLKKNTDYMNEIMKLDIYFFIAINNSIIFFNIYTVFIVLTF